jgi:mono/diheme cytochrome c family protein
MKGAMAGVGNGATVYSTNCSSCHQATGKGQPGVFPPLAGNAVVTGPADKVIHIVKNGLSGKISVNGATFNGQMPAWKGTLSNADIAHVISYIRDSWGNHAPPVTEAQVAATK